MKAAHSDGAGSAELTEVITISATTQGCQQPTTTVDGLLVAFKDVAFSVPSSKARGETVDLIKGVSGFLYAGEMAALMGGSGSGKSTLLDVLAGRKTIGRVSGDIVYGGATPTPQFLRKHVGYVEQNDTLLPELTVREMLLYTVGLKRPLTETHEEKQHAVDLLLHKLGLDCCADVMIGDAMVKGISGGQAKRASIGVALISNPRVLFLDEPTSGLDACTAHEVMKVVRCLALEGTTVCAAIHSPTPSTFGLFDRVLVLACGRTVYFGERGASLLTYAVECWPESSSAFLPSEFREGDTRSAVVNDTLWLANALNQAAQSSEVENLAEAYSSSALKQVNDGLLASYLAPHAAAGAAAHKDLATRSSTVTPWYWALATILRAVLHDCYCHRAVPHHPPLPRPALVIPRIADKVLLAFIMLTLYPGIGDDYSIINLVNIQSCLFCWALLPAFSAAVFVPSILLERPVFYRERSDGMYSVPTYLLSKLIEEVLIAFVNSVVWSSAIFYVVQLQGSWLLFTTTFFITVVIGIVLAYLVSAVSPNMEVAAALLPTYALTLLFFAGLMNTPTTMPKYWFWYYRIDFLSYSFGALVINHFEHNDVIVTGTTTTLELFGLVGASKWAQVGYLLCFLAFFSIATVLATTFIKHQRR